MTLKISYKKQYKSNNKLGGLAKSTNNYMSPLNKDCGVLSHVEIRLMAFLKVTSFWGVG